MDINQVAAIVKSYLLSEGTFQPSVFVELDDTEVETVVLSELVSERYTTPERAKILFDAGRVCGRKTEEAEQGVTGLCMASMVRYAPDKEGILIAMMGEGNGLTHSTRMYEVLRTGSDTVDLLEVPQLSGEGMLSPLLPSFMMGIVTVRQGKTKDEAARWLPAILMEYERTIKKQE